MKSEHRVQQEIIIWFHNEYPSLRGLLCYNNNNSEGGYKGAKNKYLGIVPGRSDLVLYYKGEAIMIELKNETGTQKPLQKKWEALVRKQGFSYVIIRSLEEFKNMIKGMI